MDGIPLVEKTFQRPPHQRHFQQLKNKARRSECSTDKVKLIPPTDHLSMTSSRRRSGLIAISNLNICLGTTGYRENIEQLTQSSEHEALIVLAITLPASPQKPCLGFVEEPL